MSAYDLDLHAWAFAQADALRRRSANEIDWENVAEEIESLGKQQLAELTNRLEILIVHLLKWAHQPNLQSRSWSLTIKEQRARIRRLIRQNPSLKAAEHKAFIEAYDFARLSAAAETGLMETTFPEGPQFSLADSLDDGFLPEPVTLSQSPR